MEVNFIASSNRGQTKTKWLQSDHTYNFGRYWHKDRVNFGTLRVFNEDRVIGGEGFDSHAHDNMEIITIVCEGSLVHKDSTGTEKVIKKGNVQVMSAGKGIEHSEINPSKEESVHFFQIWIYPHTRDLNPSYSQRSFSIDEQIGSLVPIASSRPMGNALSIGQDATLLWGILPQGTNYTHPVRSTKYGTYLFVVDGQIELGEYKLGKGDSAEITNTREFELKVGEGAELILIEVGMGTL